jgi:hypothetical protein
VFFARNDSFRLMPAGEALTGADFQTLERIRRPSNQIGTIVALATADRRNKFLIFYSSFITRPRLQRECGACPPSSAPDPHSTVPVPDKAMVCTEDGK